LISSGSAEGSSGRSSEDDEGESVSCLSFPLLLGVKKEDEDESWSWSSERSSSSRLGEL
jgi:hypothetical protein